MNSKSHNNEHCEESYFPNNCNELQDKLNEAEHIMEYQHNKICKLEHELKNKDCKINELKDKLDEAKGIIEYQKEQIGKLSDDLCKQEKHFLSKIKKLEYHLNQKCCVLDKVEHELQEKKKLLHLFKKDNHKLPPKTHNHKNVNHDNNIYHDINHAEDLLHKMNKILHDMH